MAITGNLKTFYLSSVLQLLSNDKKTGILELTDGTDIVQVYLRDGTIINAFGSSRVDRLTNYLQSEGIITEEQLQKCMKISAHTEKKIGMVMVEQGIISPEQLENLLHRQIEQTLYSLFLWEQGEFQYRDQNFDLSGQIITSFDTMQVVLEASRRVDEISEIKKRVPKDHEVLEVNPDTNAVQKTKLTTVERAVLSLVNGKRSVKKVITDSGYDELKVYKTLFSLATSGLLREEKTILKRPEDVDEEKIKPHEDKTIATSTGDYKHAAGNESSEPDTELFRTQEEPQTDYKKPRETQDETDKPDQADDAIFDDSDTNNEPTAADEPAKPSEELLETPDDVQDDDAAEELILEPASEMDEQETEEQESVPDLLESLAANPDQPDKTIVKIDGKLISDEDPLDKETGKHARPKAQGQAKAAEILTPFKNQHDLTEDDDEFARKKQRILKKIAVGAAIVIALVVVILLVKMILFSETDEPASIQTPATEQIPVAKEKTKKPAKEKIPKPVPAEEKKPMPDTPALQPQSALGFFQDEKGWISINLPQGFTVSEQPSQNRTSVTIQYGDDIRLTLSIIQKSEDWNAEDAMYASIMKIKESGIHEIKDYSTLKNAGCPGYVLHFINNQNPQPLHTALYRFVCFNKSLRMEISSLNWRTPADRERYRQICTIFENSFFIYE